VAVNNAFGMRELHRIADASQQIESLAGWKASTFGIVGEHLAGDEFHREIGAARGYRLDTSATGRSLETGLRFAFARLGPLNGLDAGFVNLCNAGMLELAKELSFMLEALQNLRRRKSRANHLQRDRAARVLLLRLENDSHAAFADFSQKAVFADS